MDDGYQSSYDGRSIVEIIRIVKKMNDASFLIRTDLADLKIWVLKMMVGQTVLIVGLLKLLG